MGAIAKRIQTSRANLDNPNKPIGVFLFAGTSGVGKTETALVAYTDEELLTKAGLERLHKLAGQLRKVPGVANVLSLAQAKLPGSPLSSQSRLQRHRTPYASRYGASDWARACSCAPTQRNASEAEVSSQDRYRPKQ